MTITYKNFEIEVSENTFDLYQVRPPKQTHKAKTGDYIRCCLGYFSKLPQAILKIIQVEMSNREEKISLANFMELYRTFRDEVENAVIA